MRISLIVAVSKNGVIGRDNQLLWHIPEDLKNFKRLTMNHPMIMGRKTFQSIGKPLPGRDSIVISRDFSCDDSRVHIYNNIDDAINFALTKNEEIFIIGGEQIYNLALPKVDRLYLSLIDKNYEGDAFFDLSSISEFNETERVVHEGWTFYVYDRRPKVD